MALIERLRQERELPFKVIVNDALRKGLREMSGRPTRRTPFVTRSADLGRCRFADVDNIGEVLALGEGDAAT
ncbi:MAG: hypothetical protein IT522_07425 [Burkholderiales bacterium]|nr:hypothetical protein [Burkholderiales bacterium]